MVVAMASMNAKRCVAVGARMGSLCIGQGLADSRLRIPKDEAVLEVAAPAALHIIFVADREAEPGARPAEALVELEDAAIHLEGLPRAWPGSVPPGRAVAAFIDVDVAKLDRSRPTKTDA